MRTPTMILQACGLTAAGLLMACASAPRTEYIESQAALRAANQVNAGENPKAAYHLQLAEEKIAAAEPLMDEGGDEKRTARYLLVEATKDADLAMEYARTDELKQEVARAQQKVSELESQNALQSMNSIGEPPSYMNEGQGTPGVRPEGN